MKILIITGGNLDLEWAGKVLEDKTFDRIIAADSGLSWCRKLGIIPTDILGDFDSLQEPDLLEEYEKMTKAPIRHYPERKDFTDTDLALQLAREMQADEILLLAATGTRIDHTLANLSLLISMKEKGIHAVIMDPHNSIEVMSGPEKRNFRKNFEEVCDREYLSMIAVTPQVKGITMQGFSYPLENAVLHAATSLGISNEIVGKEGNISIEEGIALVIRARD